MTTYVNTSASEIFSRFKGPKMDSLFHFTINFEESYSRTSLTTINLEESYLVPRYRRLTFVESYLVPRYRQARKEEVDSGDGSALY